MCAHMRMACVVVVGSLAFLGGCRTKEVASDPPVSATSSASTQASAAAPSTPLMATASSSSTLAPGPGLAGIYKVTSQTKNKKGCGAPGPAVDDADPFFVVRAGTTAEKALGITWYAQACTSLGDCVKIGKGEAIGSGSFIYSLQGSEDALKGELTLTGFGDGKICKDAEVSTVKVVRVGNDVTFENRAIVASYPTGKDGMCSTDGAKKATAGKACGSLTVTKGTKTQSL